MCTRETILYYSNNQPLQGIYVIVFIQILLFFVHTWNNNIRKKKEKNQFIKYHNNFSQTCWLFCFNVLHHKQFFYHPRSYEIINAERGLLKYVWCLSSEILGKLLNKMTISLSLHNEQIRANTGTHSRIKQKFQNIDHGWTVKYCSPYTKQPRCFKKFITVLINLLLSCSKLTWVTSQYKF